MSQRPAPEWNPPAEFGDYRLLQPLGRGQMGQVYLAHDTLLARNVALKFISATEPDDAARKRFLVEARAAARLHHPNVVTVYQVGELDGRPFLVSEFVRGQSLDQIAKPISWSQALEIGVGLARGLAVAHRNAILHRDLKPANAILAEDGHAKLIDFGLAKVLEARPGDEHSGIEHQDESETEEHPSAAFPTSPVPFTMATSSSTLPLAPPPQTPTAATLPPASTTLPPDPVASSTVPAARPVDSLAGATTERDSLRHLGHQLGTLSGAGQLTRAGSLMGTPDYMAPEIWRHEPATRRSDVYSLGALLYELCSGHPPHSQAPLPQLRRQVQELDARPLALAALQIEPRLAAIIDRCLRREPGERYASGEELRADLELLANSRSGSHIPVGNPYRGLRPFEAEHSALFFGRDAEIGALVERLRGESFVLVAGDSGVGKSSICRAGVLPRIAAGALEDGRRYTVTRMVPGRHPFATLMTVLAEQLGVTPESLGRQLQLEPASLGPQLRRRLGDGAGLLLFVDQLEELFTNSDPVEAAQLDEMLLRLAAGVAGVRLLATVRADFLTRVAGLRWLGDEAARSLYLLRPLPLEKMRDVVVGPAERAGIRFESEKLVDELVESTAHTDGGLPLLQFALAELWEARDQERGEISSAVLAVMGGVAGALARHADAVVAALLPTQRTAARRVMMRLVTLENTRARRTEQELVGDDPAARAAVDGLVRGRLVIAHEAEDGSAYELAHEVLIHGWGMLRRWLLDFAEWRATRERLAQAAADWERLKRSRDGLWSAGQLAEIAHVELTDLTPREKSFLEESRRAARRRRRRRYALVAAVPALIAALYGGLQLNARREVHRRVEQQMKDARTSFAMAMGEATELLHLRREAFQRFDEGAPEAGASAWAKARVLEGTLERDLVRASQVLEASLMLDAGRRDVPALLGDVLYQRALVAERAGRSAQRDELLQRLALYDAGGDRLRRWSASATLAVATIPREAEVRLERYTATPDGHLIAGPARSLGASPVAAIELEPGSYRLAIAAPGRIALLYPIQLQRDEHIALELAPPLVSAVPEGFGYVAPGRFLFGSTADDELRRSFFEALPVHERSTAGYLIARHEVTYAEWIEFLRGLPSIERAQHFPGTGANVGGSGALRLEELGGGEWRLRLQPAGVAHFARSGETLRYPARARRGEQNWLRLPVTAISATDAEAYVTWLRLTGRLPNARLCTELEWERAARGADAREYPHGDHLDPDEANFDLTYGKEPTTLGPDEVGSHLATQSPFGLDDLCGNAFEWTTSVLADGRYVARGGSFFYDSSTARLSNRQVSIATLRDASVGIRLCADPPPSAAP